MSHPVQFKSIICRARRDGSAATDFLSGALLQALLLPVDYEPPYAREASFFLFLMFLYSLWNFAVTQRLVQVLNVWRVTCNVTCVA